MNDETRAALVHLLQTVMEISYERGQQRSHYDLADEAKRLAEVIEDDFLNDRAATVAEPDAETVERVAKAMFQSLRPIWGDDIPAEEIPEGDDPDQYYEYSISWEQWNKYGYGLDYDSLSEMRADDLRKLARAAIAAMPSGRDENWLDDALDSVHPSQGISVGPEFGRKYGKPHGASIYFQIGVDQERGVPLYANVTGTGTTRKAAILDAVQKAKEASGES